MARRRHRPSPEILRSAVDLIRRERPKAVAVPYWDDRHPDHGAASRVLDLAVFRSGLRRFVTDVGPWRPEWTCYYFINNAATPSFVVDVSEYYERKARGAGLSPQPVRARRDIGRSDTAYGFHVPSVGREPRCAVRRAGRRRVRRGRGRARANRPRIALQDLAREDRHHLLRLGGRQRGRRHRTGARAGRSRPRRAPRQRGPPVPLALGHAGPAIFERVDTPSYPLFREPQYLIALTNTLVRVSRTHELDILHAHYAVPHATAAYLAHADSQLGRGSRPPRTVTTLHGTDITLVGSDASYAGVVGFSIERSHGITAVSESLRRDTGPHSPFAARSG